MSTTHEKLIFSGTYHYQPLLDRIPILLLGAVVYVFVQNHDYLLGVYACLALCSLYKTQRHSSQAIDANLILLLVISAVILSPKVNQLPKFYTWRNLIAQAGGPVFHIISNSDKYYTALAWLPHLYFLRKHAAIHPPQPIAACVSMFLRDSISMCTPIVTLAWAFRFIHWAPSFPDFTGYWALNMLGVCFCEEIIFRGVVQNIILSVTPTTPRKALLAASLIFGVAHAASGLTMIVLSSIAGWFYGRIYLKSGRLAMAVGLHFMLNSVHFFLFTYPHA